jgi:integrase
VPRKKKAQRRAPGEGSIRWKASQKRYVGYLTLGTRDGKQVRKYVYGPRGDNSNAAFLGVSEGLQSLRARKPTVAATDSLSHFLAQWVANADHLRANTRATYDWAAKKYICPSALGQKRLLDVDPIDVRNFYAALNAGAHTRQKIHILLHRVFEEALDLEIIGRNPVSRVKSPTVRRREMTVWSPEEVLTFLRVISSDRLYAMYLLALTTTMGPAELFGLQRPDVNLKGAYLSVNRNMEYVRGRRSLGETKTDSRRRRIDLPRHAVDALRQRYETALGEGHGGSPFVFTTALGAPLHKDNFRRRVWVPLLERVAEEAEKTAREAGRTEYRFPRIRFYDLRHSCNALMGYLGVPIQVARERMGHSSIKTTDDVYGHLYESMQRDVADKFDRFLDGIAT